MADTIVGFGFPYPEGASGSDAAGAEDQEAIASSESSREADRLRDLALLSGLREGEESAYEALVLRFEHVVYGIVSRIMDDPADACDVVQEVFLKVFRKVGAFRGDSSLKTWIYRIAINEARNHRRWFGRHRAKEVGLDPDPHWNGWDPDLPGRGEWLEDTGQSPYQTALDHEMQAILEQALSRLSHNHRAALVLREVDGLSYEEIADILDVPEGTVKSRILRARDCLRRELTDLVKPHSVTAEEMETPAHGIKALKGRHAV